jgi:hypothetical protein
MAKLMKAPHESIPIRPNWFLEQLRDAVDQSRNRKLRRGAISGRRSSTRKLISTDLSRRTKDQALFDIFQEAVDILFHLVPSIGELRLFNVEENEAVDVADDIEEFLRGIIPIRILSFQLDPRL